MSDTIMMNISKEIKLYNLPEEVKEHLKKTLTLKNPNYDRLVRMHKGNARVFYGVPKEFKYYEEDIDALIVPRGMKQRLINFFQKINLKVDIKENLVSIKYGK